MDYRIKVVIDGTEYLEESEQQISEDGIEYTAPSIKDIHLNNNVCEEGIKLGAAAADKLTFTIVNPAKTEFDGSKIKLWVAPPEDETMTKKDEIEEEVGDSTEIEEATDMESDETFDEEAELAEGEELTKEEAAETDALLDEIAASGYEIAEGIAEEPETETTEEEEEPEWRPVGVFYAYSYKKSDADITLTCFDGFVLMNGIFVPAKKTDTIQNMYDDLRSQIYEECGITVDEHTFEGVYDHEITWNLTCSYREALGYFAGLAGGFATFDEDGNAGISMYSVADEILLLSDLTYVSESSSGEVVVSEIECDTTPDGIENDIITAGAGQGLKFENPFVTDEILESILAEYNGLRYSGGIIEGLWDYGLTAGEIVRVVSDDEYRSYLTLQNALAVATDTEEAEDIKSRIASVGKMMIISNQSISLNGNCTTVIRGAKQTELAKANQQIPSSKKKLEMLKNKLEETMQEIRDNIIGSAGAGKYELIYSDGDILYPIGFRIYNTEDSNKFWQFDYGGLRFTADGGHNFTMAADLEGNIIANKIAANSVIAEEVEMQNLHLTGGSVNIQTSNAKYSAITLRTPQEFLSLKPEGIELVDDSTERKTEIGPGFINSGGLGVRPDGIFIDGVRLNGKSFDYEADYLEIEGRKVVTQYALENGHIKIGNVEIMWGIVTPDSLTKNGDIYYGEANVNFLGFKTTPAVMVCGSGGYYTYRGLTAYSVTKDGFTAREIMTSDTPRGIRWVAIGHV